MEAPIDVANLPEFEAAHFLKNPTSMAAYLTDILAANDTALLTAAMRDLARVIGSESLANLAGMTEQDLESATHSDPTHQLETATRVCQALASCSTLVPSDLLSNIAK